MAVAALLPPLAWKIRHEDWLGGVDSLDQIVARAQRNPRQKKRLGCRLCLVSGIRFKQNRRDGSFVGGEGGEEEIQRWFFSRLLAFPRWDQ